jgi:hypothetical protein
MKKRPLPKPCDTINCDPNRDEPDCAYHLVRRKT